jgi:hypothetical protein
MTGRRSKNGGLRPAVLFSMAAAVSAACALPAHTALSAESLPAGMRACATHKDRDERLACFDAEVARLTSPAAQVQSFGVDNSELARKQAAQQPAVSEEITARVASVTARPHGELIVTLDNGQVWSQMHANPQFTLQAGDSVKVKTGALSSYVLVSPSGRATKVTRTK